MKLNYGFVLSVESERDNPNLILKLYIQLYHRFFSIKCFALICFDLLWLIHFLPKGIFQQLPKCKIFFYDYFSREKGQFSVFSETGLLQRLSHQTYVRVGLLM